MPGGGIATKYHPRLSKGSRHYGLFMQPRSRSHVSTDNVTAVLQESHSPLCCVPRSRTAWTRGSFAGVGLWGGGNLKMDLAYVPLLPLTVGTQVTELMGLYVSACQILSWLPPIAFTIRRAKFPKCPVDLARSCAHVLTVRIFVCHGRLPPHCGSRESISCGIGRSTVRSPWRHMRGTMAVTIRLEMEPASEHIVLPRWTKSRCMNVSFRCSEQDGRSNFYVLRGVTFYPCRENTSREIKIQARYLHDALLDEKWIL
jgi:hypothetical protein